MVKADTSSMLYNCYVLTFVLNASLLSSILVLISLVMKVYAEKIDKFIHYSDCKNKICNHKIIYYGFTTWLT